jgi:Tol biopolymer transport system component
VAIVDASGGQVTAITDSADNAADPSWLHDGRLVFSSERNGARDLWMANADGTDARRLFALDGDEWAPRISPAGDRILFHNDGSGDFDVYSARLDGTDLRIVAGGAGFDGVASWSPDGALVAYYHRASPESGNAASQRSTWATAEILVVPAAGGDSRPLTKNAVRDQSPAWSPDGRTIAWTSCASGNLEVWLMDADGRNPRQLTQTPRAAASPEDR